LINHLNNNTGNCSSQKNCGNRLPSEPEGAPTQKIEPDFDSRRNGELLTCSPLFTIPPPSRFDALKGYGPGLYVRPRASSEPERGEPQANGLH
jgi:hypothetical protein